MFNSGAHLEKKRDEIIMACLNGGQHIDAALEAADRLVPQQKIDEAWAKDKELADGYNKRMEELWAAKRKDYKDPFLNAYPSRGTPPSFRAGGPSNAKG